MEALCITWDGLYFGLKLFGVATLAGTGFTAGMWIFCRASKWAPINITVNANVNNADD